MCAHADAITGPPLEPAPQKQPKSQKNTIKHPWSRPKRGGAGHPTSVAQIGVGGLWSGPISGQHSSPRRGPLPGTANDGLTHRRAYAQALRWALPATNRCMVDLQVVMLGAPTSLASIMVTGPHHAAVTATSDGRMRQSYHFQYRWIYGMSLLKRYECIGVYPLDRQFLSAGETHLLP
jgi:hypothetical protein